MSSSHVRPVPYYRTHVEHNERALAAELRKDLLPLVKRRLSNHHLCGLPHGWAIKFIKANSEKYPYFVRTDIRKFYPSIRHLDIVTGIQLAHRDLLSMKVVSQKFKQKYVAPLMEWTKNLPLEHRGIPISSPFSALAAPLMLIPTWLTLKRIWNVPTAVYIDDILILCKDRHEASNVHEWLHNHMLSYYDLELNVHKTESGRIATKQLDFCGWSFKSNYARIAEDRIERFKKGFIETVRKCKRQNLLRSIAIKRINRRIDGFGNYYKHGNVKRQFEELDIFVRAEVKATYYGTQRCTFGTFRGIGLRFFEDILNRHKEKNGKKSKPRLFQKSQLPVKSREQIIIDHLIAVNEKLLNKGEEIYKRQKEMLNALERIANALGEHL